MIGKHFDQYHSDNDNRNIPKNSDCHDTTYVYTDGILSSLVQACAKRNSQIRRFRGQSGVVDTDIDYNVICPTMTNNENE